MNKYWQIAITIILTALVWSCSGNKSNTNEHDTHGDGHHVHHHHDEMGANEISGSSLYHLQSTWVNQYGDSLHLKDLKGEVKVVSMIYTHCQYACPRIVADMQLIKDSLESKAVVDVNYVLVTIDPERDRPDRLLEFARDNRLDLEDWTLLTSARENIQELAVVLGVQFKAINDKDFSHSNLISVLDSSGEILFRQEGLGTDPSATIHKITKEMKN